MNSKERVRATLDRQPADRTPIDCWLYQRQFVEMLAAEYGPREQFLDEFGIDIFVGFVPWPNQTGRLLDTQELPAFSPGDPRDPKWISHRDWNYAEIGYDMMHPLQESAGMDPATVKAKYGDKFVIYGSLDVIDGLLAYEGDALEAYITRRFEIYAPGGGFIYNTGHFVQPDIPPKRLLHAYSVVNRLARQDW